MAFSGQCGGIRSQAGNLVAGFGSSAVHNAKGLSASMTATATITPTHFYVFTIVSITFYRAVNRAKNFISVLRTS